MSDTKNTEKKAPKAKLIDDFEAPMIDIEENFTGFGFGTIILKGSGRIIQGRGVPDGKNELNMRFVTHMGDADEKALGQWISALKLKGYQLYQGNKIEAVGQPNAVIMGIRNETYEAKRRAKAAKKGKKANVDDGRGNADNFDHTTIN